MKRLGILVLISIMFVTFTACGYNEKTEKQEKVDKPVVEADSYDYDIERVDKSKNEQLGQEYFSLIQYYDYVKVSGEGNAVTEVNSSLKKGYDSFIQKIDEAVYYFDSDLETQKQSSETQFESTEYLNTTDAEIMQNKDNIFSIKYTSKWFVGGVYNEDYVGETYSVKTGKKLNIAEVLGLSHDEAMNRVLITVEDAVDDNPESFEPNALELVEEMGIENISFYMKNGKIFLCFKTYEISYGAAGSFIFELEDEKDDEDDDNDDDDYDDFSTEIDDDDCFVEYLGKTVSELKDDFGNKYESLDFEGGLAISFNDPSVLYIVGDGWQEVNDDMVARNLIIWNDKKILPEISGAMTYPDLEEAVSSEIKLKEPVYYNNEAEDRWEYNLEFTYKGYNFSYIWMDDPNTSVSKEVWVSK